MNKKENCFGKEYCTKINEKINELIKSRKLKQKDII